MHSFVYVDYGVTRQALIDEFENFRFNHYGRVLERDVPVHDLLPPGWNGAVPELFAETGGRERLAGAQQACTPFAHWSVWKRWKGRTDCVGPELFSFLFIGGEGLALFQALYGRNAIAPRVLCLIQPGHAFGGNWTNFFDPAAPLWSSVAASGLQPEYLLTGSWGEQQDESAHCPIPGYEFVRRLRKYEPARVEYVYSAAGAWTRWDLAASVFARLNDFPLTVRTQHSGILRTIDLWRQAGP